ncbi:putative Pre-mRNA-splicing factor cwc-24 [Cryphonectria parasitica EP155]|uniref:Pre-mRNA-splicing factor CWC24 n=1 Tax=Cryphonectria parasitica (strain ATCC 38755 / EP155) TaxID=660469 RepID=A0A9P5CJN0_CRYP1|nr:putative Pre-mRNA-splicing factor cwc-24 [Cryphonectria parasitica EP155]KAF3760086.1 putative Pre-mRNA-splicing factor cwc-24 [Cryphonectria parasitica EP155]
MEEENSSSTARFGRKGKANLRKRAPSPPPAAADNSDSDEPSSSDDDDGNVEGGGSRRIKRRKVNTGAVTVSSRDPNSGTTVKDVAGTTVFSADRNVPITDSNDATKHTDWFEETSKGGDGLSAKSLLGSTRAMPAGASSGPDGTYKGLAGRTNFIQKNPNAPNRTVGPIKAPTNIRTVTVMDYAPDVCKDYKQTGFCGFGDNCKFLHSREDYKQSWSLDREWEDVTKGKKNLGGTVVASADRKGRATADDDDDDAEEALLENIPFVCLICRGPYRSPVVTRCGHYFCEPCALQRYRKDPSCAQCSAGTNGVFNSGKRLQKLLDRKRERAAKRRQEALERGEEVSSDEEGEDEGEE